jgi:hypothetical protein
MTTYSIINDWLMSHPLTLIWSMSLILVTSLIGSI